MRNKGRVGSKRGDSQKRLRDEKLKGVTGQNSPRSHQDKTKKGKVGERTLYNKKGKKMRVEKG